MKQFLKPTKIKLSIIFSFFVLAFILSLVFRVFTETVVSNITGEKEMEHFMKNIFPFAGFILTVLKFYLYACIAVYFINKAEKNRKKD